MPFRPASVLRPLGAGFILLGGLGLVASRPALAVPGQEFIVADDDGYGIADCMKPGSECGRVMADAWCEAHGHGHAETFGLAEDVTGSTRISTAPAATAATAPTGAVVIHCGE